MSDAPEIPETTAVPEGATAAARTIDLVKVGDTVDMVTVVQPVQTAADGSYTITQADLDSSTAFGQLQALAATNDGWVNLDVVAQSPTSSGFFYVSRQLLADGSWLSTHESPTADVTTSTASPTGAQYPPVQQPPQGGVAQPNDYPPKCTHQVVATGHSWMRVGETHRYYKTWAKFHYGQVADSSVDYMFNVAPGHCAANGSWHVGNSSGTGVELNDTALHTARYFHGDFDFVKALTHWNGVGLCNPNGYSIHATSWTGGFLQGGTFRGHYDGECNTAPVHTQIGSPAYVHKTSQTGYHYDQAVTIFGVGIGAHSGFTTDVQYEYRIKHQMFICATGGGINYNLAPNVALGPWV